jgi:hypothetical protein
VNKSGIFGSPNKMIWEYFDSLRAMVRNVQNADERNIQRQVLPCVFMGIAVVETFLNTYFRILCEKRNCSGCREQTLKEIDGRTSLERKIKTWPKRFFDREIDFNQGIGLRFMNLKDLRNKLMHFKSSYDTVNLPGQIQIQGMVDISSYDGLDKNIALESLLVAEEMLEEIFRLEGISDEQIKHALHLWTGKVPDVEGIVK